MLFDSPTKGSFDLHPILDKIEFFRWWICLDTRAPYCDMQQDQQDDAVQRPAEEGGHRRHGRVDCCKATWPRSPNHQVRATVAR